MSVSPRQDYEDAVDMVTPSAVSQYLASRNWHLEARRDTVKEIWRLPGEAGNLARVMLPLATDYADFRQRFHDVLMALGQVYDVDAATLIEEIAATRADLFFVRLDQPMNDGTIPFRQAEITIESLYKMLRAAATTAHDPNHSHRGRRSNAVTEFLERDVRLGHTKPGSFVFTIVARLGPPERTLETSARPSDTGTVGPHTPFPRMAMATLARGLETTRDLTRSFSDATLESAAAFGLSAGLVESLEDITAAEGMRSLNLSFRWAAGGMTPDVGRQTIVLDRAAIDELPVVRERLVRREEPPRRTELIGTVRSLSRENVGPDCPDAATIVLIADVNGRVRPVTVTVTGDDHEWAIVAYQRKLPFTVTGDLLREGRGWCLSGDITVNSDFLRHHSTDRQRPLADNGEPTTQA